MDIDPIVQADCEDCGATLVLDPDLIKITVLGKDYTGVTLCIYCERPIITEIPESLALTLEERGVKILKWMDS